MIKDIRNLSANISNLFYIKYHADLIQNCVMRIHAHYKDVELLISGVKGIKIENKKTRFWVYPSFSGFLKKNNFLTLKWSELAKFR
jgi:hypothetical protein